MYTVDTHGIAWYLQELNSLQKRRRVRDLSVRVRRIFAAADQGQETILIPSIVLVELVYLTERGTIAPALVDRLLTDLSREPENYRVVPLDLEVVMHLRDIPASLVPEMPDRIIAASAKATRTRLISRDEALGRATGIEVVW